MVLARATRASRGIGEGWVCSSCLSRELQLVRRRSTFVRSREQVDATQSSSRNTGSICVPTRQFFSSRTRQDVPKRQSRLPESPARTRFAPSPTGYLHIGGLRTALFSYLLARRTGGQFLLRIEDTDQKRLVPDAEARLCEDLQWAGLQWDEGLHAAEPHGPYRQSERTEIYQDHARKLLDEGSAYRCFCAPQATGTSETAYVTSGCYQNCSSQSISESQERAETGKEAFTVRLHQPPDAHKRIYPDLVYGKIQRLKRSPSAPQTASEDSDAGVDAADTVLLKSDGTPTYHFANVVDDHLMHITHVIRGSEWMASTPLHYDIYTAFGWSPPQFAHVGLLVDANKAKLSKRSHGDIALDVASMRDKHGVLPYTLNNFLVLLGWSNATDDDVMDLDALVRNFDLKFTRGNAMVRMEKLWYLQKQHVSLRCALADEKKSLAPIKDVVGQIAAEVRRQFADPFINAEVFSEVYMSEEQPVPDPLMAYVTEVLLADSKAFQNAPQFVERNRYFFAFDETQVPSEKEFYNKAQTLGPGRLHDCIAAVMESDGGEDQYDEPPTIARLESQFHADLETMAEIGLSTRPSDFLPSALDGDAASSVMEEEPMPEPSFKNFQAALMKYLREKLAYGLPGPSVSRVMALLGHRECNQRLDISYTENNEMLEEREWQRMLEEERKRDQG